MNPKQFEADDRAKKRQRHGPHDNQRLHQRFELGGHNHVDEKDAEREGQIQAGPASFPFFVLPRKGEGSFGRPEDFIGEGFFNLVHGFSEAGLAEVGLDEGDAFAVDSANFARPFANAQRGNGA